MKGYILICFLCSTFIFSQERNDLFKTIDSIQHKKWDKTYYDLDSIGATEVEKINKRTDNGLILKINQNITSNEILPITPFDLNKFQLSKKWFFYGKNDLFFNQASFSNWNSGGQTNIGILSKLEYHLDYKNNNHYLENIFSVGYGMNSSKGQSSRKTEDYINFMTNYGYKLSKNYYISAGAQLITQFSAGFDYNATPDPNYNDRISKFFAPAYINTGIGVLYNPNKNFQIIVRPINGKLTIINDQKLQKKGRYGLEKDGQSIRHEFGAMLNASYRLKIYEKMFFDNKLNVFSNYTRHPERIDVSYNGVLSIRFNKFISSIVSLDLAYDHDQIKKIQTKQALSIGFSYDIGKVHKHKNNKRITPFVN